MVSRVSGGFCAVSKDSAFKRLSGKYDRATLAKEFEGFYDKCEADKTLNLVLIVVGPRCVVFL